MDEQSVTVRIDGNTYTAKAGSTILEVINQLNLPHPQICYVPEVDPIQTCDTCIVEANGKLVRSCSTTIEKNMNILLSSPRAKAPKRKPWIASWKITYCIVRFVTTIMEIVKYIIRLI